MTSDGTPEFSSFSGRVQPAGTTNPSRRSTDLAIERTRLAHERTLMAWIRTAASLISFGFSIYKFFDYMPESAVYTELQLISPRIYALMMIGIGLVTLMLASIQQARYVEKLREEYPLTGHSMATLVALLVSAMGLVTLMAVILRQ